MRNLILIKTMAILMVCILMLATGAKAQDVIVLVDASEIQAKVITVGTNEITYKRWESQNGPDYQILKKDVFFIRYKDGSKDVFNRNPLSNQQEQEDTQNITAKSKGKYIHRILLNGYAELGIPFDASEIGPAIHGSIGARIYDYGFVGIGLGFDAIFPTLLSEYYGIKIIDIPILFNLRAYYPIKDNFYTFFDISVGVNILFSNMYFPSTVEYTFTTGRIKILLGIEYKRFEVALGYDCIPFGNNNTAHMGFLKIGLRLGKMK